MAGSQYPATSGGYMVASMPPGAAQTASFQKAAEDQEAHSHVFKQHEEWWLFLPQPHQPFWFASWSYSKKNSALGTPTQPVVKLLASIYL